MSPTRFIPRPLVLALAACAALSACGGGGGGAPAGINSSQLASLSGSAVDAPIAGAQITITAGAPSGDSGATVIGSVTANASGGFTLQVTLPSGSVPVFANAVDPTDAALVLSSYLGQSDALAAAGTLSSSNLPDLDISPVTTAALAVYAQLNGGYTNLTPAAYAGTLQTYGSDVLAIAAAIKAVGDKLCTPSTTITSTTTTNLAAAIAAGAKLSSSNPVTLSTAITELGGNCAGVLASLPSVISADPVFGPELELGDVIDAGAATVPAGTYVLQGVVAQTGFGATASTLSSTLTTPNPVSPADVVNDTAVTVSSTGAISSTDGKVSGSIVGNLLTLTLIDPATSTTYTLRGKIGSMPSAMTGGTQAYAVRSGGTYTSNGSTMLAKFNAVLAPAAASANWAGVAAPGSTTRTEGVSCAAGSFPVRLDVFAARDGGGTIGECIAPSVTGWALSTPSSTNAGDDFGFDGQSGMSTASAPSLSAPTWTPATGAPYVLSATGASITVNGTQTTGTLYYVMGSQTIVIAGTTGTTGTTSNVLLHMHGNALTQVSEAASNSGDANTSSSGLMGDGGSSSHQADH